MKQSISIQPIQQVSSPESAPLSDSNMDHASILNGTHVVTPSQRKETCVDPLCNQPRSSWQPGNVRHAFGGQGACSPACLEALLRTALVREHALGAEAALRTGPRVRIGQILVQQGVITDAQLARALQSQRLTGAGRLGTWLRQQTELPEKDFAEALGIQWQCPVFKIGAFAPERMSAFLPKLLAEALSALPLRHSREPERLTICFEDRLDTELLRACERMHGMPVEGGLLASEDFWYGSGELLKASFPPVSVVKATSLEEMIEAMTETLVRAGAIDAHLVYVQGYYWLRMWVAGVGENAPTPCDVLCTVRLSPDSTPESQLIEEMMLGLELEMASNNGQSA